MSPIRKTVWFLSALILLGMIALYVGQLNRDGLGEQAAAPRIGAPFELVDHNGEVISESAMEGKPVAVFFGFTHCPDVCPTTLAELTGWLDRLGEAGDGIEIFFITVDPERDVPQVLASYIDSFADRVTAITGPTERVHSLADAWHVYYDKVPLEGGGYTMDHTASVFLVDSHGRLKSTIAYGENPDTALQKLRNLAES